METAFQMLSAHSKLSWAGRPLSPATVVTVSPWYESVGSGLGSHPGISGWFRPRSGGGLGFSSYL
jgi:hypothetical protein